jgi:hypothetical protein
VRPVGWNVSVIQPVRVCVRHVFDVGPRAGPWSFNPVGVVCGCVTRIQGLCPWLLLFNPVGVVLEILLAFGPGALPLVTIV